jgi:alcohol dehydrogenase class IV
MRFEFATAGRIIFGAGALADAGSIAAGMGRCACVVTGQKKQRAEPLLQQLEDQGISYISYAVDGEPTTEVVMAGAEEARGAECDLVIGIGGGSVVDTGKVIAALLTNGGDLLDYLEVVGKGEPLQARPASYLAIPTTAGTGAEVTRNAVLAVPEERVKVSMRHAWLLPSVAVVDPVLTYELPPAITASTGLDALTQLIEAFVSNQANPMTDGICREGMQRAGRSLLRAFQNGDDTRARKDMAIASLFSGLALANAKLGAVHGFAGPLGGMYPAAHGVICARFLPWVMEANVRALQERAKDSEELKRFDEVGRILTGDRQAKAADGVEWIQQFCRTLEIPPLKEFGLQEAEFPVVVEKAQKASSMKGNPILLTEDELGKILHKAYSG